MEARLILDVSLEDVLNRSDYAERAGNSAWNMAVDEALLESARDGAPTLRFYGWSAPTLSLGYFQSAADRGQHAASQSAQLVRRSTGGGAILHHHEITYSFTTRSSERSTDESQFFYHAFHETAIDLLKSLHADAALCHPAERVSRRDDPFLCFQRRTEGDVLIGDVKVLGSAQRRRHAALLQHGSLLLARSPLAPELAGIGDLIATLPPIPDLLENWCRRLAQRLKVSFCLGELTAADVVSSENLRTSKFGDSHWTLRR